MTKKQVAYVFYRIAQLEIRLEIQSSRVLMLEQKLRKEKTSKKKTAR